MSDIVLGGTQEGGNGASEFVRKLLRMLKDVSHQDVVRWGEDGETFVVLDVEKFTRLVLPKHFNHRNLSSFTRQLSKYDFHRVRPLSDNESSPNANLLKFKHPYFLVDSKDDISKIRRKASAPRKPQVTGDITANHHIGVISEQLAATQQQMQQLQELLAAVSQTNRLLIHEVLTLRKMLNTQKQAQHEMLNYLAQWSEAHNSGLLGKSINWHGAVSTAEEDGPVPELRRARELLSSVTVNSIADRELGCLHDVHVSAAESAADPTPMIMLASVVMMYDPMSNGTVISQQQQPSTTLVNPPTSPTTDNNG
ncbi:Stress response regulator [Fusarium keratoplasticum]|uniref:Stress response regulator n=1 Tax=Fusarium keratoplasticum TaxID=1328300 RepID=A0ACC0R6V0_9HYPO|nr:Stress response regulator [Fusarium keratoplasticum]KAI8676056.1 Stress response regulator [Fusarium keratoplasticum]